MWLLQVLPSNNDTIIEKRDGCKGLFKRNTVKLKILDRSKWLAEKMMVQLNCMAASAPLK